jgi:hypothetical protein
VLSHNTSTLNTSTFDNVSVTASPSPASSPNPSNGATGVATNATLTWSGSGASSYDVNFGTSNPPPQVSSAQAAGSYTPSTLANNTTYFWQVVARNSAGTTTGPVWSFTTVAVAQPPGMPGSPNPSNGATGVATNATLTWSAAGATTYNVRFGSSNPPPGVATGLTTASYTPPALNPGTTYYWQIVAANANGTATGPVWSFTTDIAPSVAIASPPSGATFTNPATITLTATATDPDGTIANVRYYSGSKLIGSATATPYTIGWKTGVGTYTLTAVATDNNGLQTTSAPVTVKVVKK